MLIKYLAESCFEIW